MIFVEIETGFIFLMLIKNLGECTLEMKAWDIGEICFFSKDRPKKFYDRDEISSNLEFIGFL